MEQISLHVVPVPLEQGKEGLKHRWELPQAGPGPPLTHVPVPKCHIHTLGQCLPKLLVQKLFQISKSKPALALLGQKIAGGTGAACAGCLGSPDVQGPQMCRVPGWLGAVDQEGDSSVSSCLSDFYLNAGASQAGVCCVKVCCTNV